MGERGQFGVLPLRLPRTAGLVGGAAGRGGKGGEGSAGRGLGLSEVPLPQLRGAGGLPRLRRAAARGNGKGKHSLCMDHQMYIKWRWVSNVEGVGTRVNLS
jgi:hypothetical protein